MTFFGRFIQCKLAQDIQVLQAALVWVQALYLLPRKRVESPLCDAAVRKATARTSKVDTRQSEEKFRTRARTSV